MIGGIHRTPNIDGDRIHACTRRRRRVEGAKVLDRIVWEGLPVGKQAGGSLEGDLAYANHRGAAKYGQEVLTKAAVDVALRGANVFSVTGAKNVIELWLSRVEVVEKETSLVIYHLTFS